MTKLVELKHQRIIVDLMYAGTKHNMTGRAVYAEIGMGNKAFVHVDMWQRLQELIPWLEEHQRKLKIFDAYRPPLAHELLHDIIPQAGFFAADASLSPHCRATAIDVCLTNEEGSELEYPTKVDAYSREFAKHVQQGNFGLFFEYLKQARHDYAEASATATQNRNELKQIMEEIGLKALPHEWWHYELPEGRENNKYPLIEWKA